MDFFPQPAQPLKYAFPCIEGEEISPLLHAPQTMGKRYARDYLTTLPAQDHVRQCCDHGTAVNLGVVTFEVKDYASFGLLKLLCVR